MADAWQSRQVPANDGLSSLARTLFIMLRNPSAFQVKHSCGLPPQAIFILVSLYPSRGRYLSLLNRQLLHYIQKKNSAQNKDSLHGNFYIDKHCQELWFHCYHSVDEIVYPQYVLVIPFLSCILCTFEAPAACASNLEEVQRAWYFVICPAFPCVCSIPSLTQSTYLYTNSGHVSSIQWM